MRTKHVGHCHICGKYAGLLTTFGVKRVKICRDCLKILRSDRFLDLLSSRI